MCNFSMICISTNFLKTSYRHEFLMYFCTTNRLFFSIHFPHRTGEVLAYSSHSLICNCTLLNYMASWWRQRVISDLDHVPQEPNSSFVPRRLKGVIVEKAQPDSNITSKYWYLEKSLPTIPLTTGKKKIIKSARILESLFSQLSQQGFHTTDSFILPQVPSPMRPHYFLCLLWITSQACSAPFAKQPFLGSQALGTVCQSRWLDSQGFWIQVQVSSSQRVGRVFSSWLGEVKVAAAQSFSWSPKTANCDCIKSGYGMMQKEYYHQ